MTGRRKLHIAIVGLGFGREFVPIYLHHPAVASVTICDANPVLVDEVSGLFGLERRTTHFADILAARDIDAVHLITGIPQHAEHTVAVLESGKHCACTVPMATSLADLNRIVNAQRTSGNPPVPLRARTAGARSFWSLAIFTRRPLPGYGKLAPLLDGAATDALCYARGGAVARRRRNSRDESALFWLRRHAG
jgi:hypothetical protein